MPLVFIENNVEVDGDWHMQTRKYVAPKGTNVASVDSINT